MNSFQILCFLEAARERNFSRAAQTLYISQPGISRHIAGLENELHVHLFERTANKRIQLTAAGNAYYEFFLRYTKELESLSERYRSIDGDPFGQLRFGYMSGWDISFFLPQMLAKFEQTQPGVVVRLISMDDQNLVQSLRNDELDVILLPRDFLPAGSEVLCEEVLSINRLILYSDRLLERMPAPQDPRDLKDLTFFVPDDALFEKHNVEMEDFSRAFGYRPKLRNVHNIETVMAYVKGGVGVTFSDSWGRNVGANGFHAFPMPARRSVVLGWPASIDERKKHLPHRIVVELQAILADMQDTEGCFPVKRLTNK